MSGLKIIYKDPAELNPRSRNPRTHSAKQIKQIAASIEQFGFVSPVLVDQNNGIIAGHGRVSAARMLGMDDIPTVRVDHLTPAQICAYVIADNKLAENAGWDRELLALELQDLSVELNFDVTITGFEVAEVDLLIGELNESEPDQGDIVPEVDRSHLAVSVPGDQWRIGNHYLLCGSALEKANYIALMQAKKAQMVFTDPPYNVPIVGHVSGRGKVRHREFAMASRNRSGAEFTGFLRTTFEHLTAFSTNGSIHFVCMDWRHMRETLDAAAPYSELENLCVWAKTNAGMGGLYRSQHELVFVFKNGAAPHINNPGLGRFGRSRSNIWNYPDVNSVGKDRKAELAMHRTVKPVALVADAILDCSKRGGIVLDAFAGAGTTLIAAEKTGRLGYGIELDPYYVDRIIRRFAEVYGLSAIHSETGKTFEEISSGRSANWSRHNAKKAQFKNGTAGAAKGPKSRARIESKE